MNGARLLLGVWLTCACPLACGSNDAGGHAGTAADGDGGLDPSSGGGGGDGGDGGGDDRGGPRPLAFRDRLVGWSGGYTGGFYPAHGYAISRRRLFSMPDALSSTLGAVTVVDVSTIKPRVYSLPVAGTVPAGTVEAFTYDPASDRVVVFVRARGATKTEIAAIAVGDREATFTILAQAGQMPTSKSMVGPLYAAGAPGVIVAGLGNSTATFTISGSTATWSAETAATISASGHAGPMEDPARGRVLAFGNLVYDPIEKKAHLEPAIRALSLAAPYTWKTLPYGGDVPPNQDGLGSTSFAAYDEKGNRVLAAALRDTPCGPATCKVYGLWSFDLGTNTWAKVADAFNSAHAYGGARPFIMQHEARRILEISDGVLVSTSLEPTNPTLADVELEQDGDLGPRVPSFATVLGDGRIVSADGRALRVLDPKDAAPRWTRFGTATFPPLFDKGGTVSADPKTGELLVFGTPRDNTTPEGTTTELYVISSDGKKTTKVVTATTPPPRAGHGAIVADGALYVVGGTHGKTVRSDVWAFERASSTWSQIATLPAPVWDATLSIGGEDLLVTGRTTSGNNEPKTSPTFAVGRKTHAVRTLDGPPTKYGLWRVAPYRGCFLGYESGDTVDGSGPTVWRCTFDGGGLTWTSTKLDEHDFVLQDLRGAASPDGLRAYFVGRHLWEVVGE